MITGEPMTILLSLALSMVLVADETEPPQRSFSFLARHCADNPDDPYCARVAAARAAPEAGAPASQREQSAPATTQGIGVYVMVQNGVVRSEPSTRGGQRTVVTSLRPGARFTAQQRVQGDGRWWLEVMMSDGSRAYVAESLARRE